MEIDRNQFVKSRNRRGMPRRNTYIKGEGISVSLHNIFTGKLFTKEFMENYLRTLLRRTIIAVALLLCIQLWNISKIKFGDTGAEQVKEVISTNYTWEKLKDVVSTIDYDKIVEVWNNQGE